MDVERVERLRGCMHEYCQVLGNLLVDLFHNLMLFLICLATSVAAAKSCYDMFASGKVGVDDILLLFIYLELGAMVGIYFKTNRMPVRFLLYVAITALTRPLIADIVHHHDAPDVSILYVTGGILLLALAVLVVRFASARFPSASPPAMTHQVRLHRTGSSDKPGTEVD